MEHSCFWHTRSMDDTCCINPNDEQSIVDTQEFSNIYRNAADTNMPSASSLDHEGMRNV